MRADASVYGNHPSEDRATSGTEPGLAQLIAELASAGLVAVEIMGDGDVGYALTPQGQVAARMMAMSRNGLALVLLGALIGSSDELN